MIFFTSDLHLGHSNIIRYCNRPFEHVADMDNTLIKNWNNKVRPDDQVYVLGDFSFGHPDKYVGYLHGRIFLVPGNHDKIKRFENWEKAGKVKILPELHRCSLNGQPMSLCHYAMRVWDRSHFGSWHLFGHSHGSMPQPFGKCRDVGVDTTKDYAPISFDEIRDFMAVREIGKVDHHDDTTM